MTNADAATYLDALVAVTADRGIPAEARQAIIQGAHALRSHDALVGALEAGLTSPCMRGFCDGEGPGRLCGLHETMHDALTNARKAP